MHAKHANRAWLNDLSGWVIGCAFAVVNTLGAGLPEKVNENALAFEMSLEIKCVVYDLSTAPKRSRALREFSAIRAVILSPWPRRKLPTLTESATDCSPPSHGAQRLNRTNPL